jgi:hypothetical protein
MLHLSIRWSAPAAAEPSTAVETSAAEPSAPVEAASAKPASAVETSAGKSTAMEAPAPKSGAAA